MNGLDIVRRAKSLSGVKYWYGAKGQKASVELANILSNQNPNVWTKEYYKKALNDIAKNHTVGDCSYLVCYAYGIKMIGSYQIREKFKIWNGSPKDGMILWRKGHVAIFGYGKAIQLKGIDYDYVEIDYEKDKYTAVLYDPAIDYNTETEGGFTKVGTFWQFIKNGEPLRGFQVLGGKRYCFSEKGNMLTYFFRVDGKTYYSHSDGEVRTGWQKIQNNWYFFHENGEMATGFRRVKAKDGTWRWYFFDENGEMLFNPVVGGVQYKTKETGEVIF